MNGDVEIEHPRRSKRKENIAMGLKIIRYTIIILLCILILGGGAFGAYMLFTTGPRPKRKLPESIAPLVRVQEVRRGTEQVIVRAMGTVIPAQQITLKSRVSGEIVSINHEFIEGGFLKAGSEILRVDAKDYELAIKQRQSQVINAEYALKLEMGQQDIARIEWEMLSGQKTSEKEGAELALRKPHLEKVQAGLMAAEANLEQARINLSRTKVITPFNAVVRSKNVDIGSQISTQDQLAELIGSDEYWIRVPLPMDRLKWINVPNHKDESGSAVRIFTDNDTRSGPTHHGVVIKLLSDLENEGRMPRILVSVKDPLGLKATGENRSPLLLNQYVRVEIDGLELEEVIRIPRASLREDSKIWVLDDDNKLRIKAADTIWRDEDSVIVKDGFESQERLIISDLTTPVEGLQLRTGGQADTTDTQPQSPGGFPAGVPQKQGNFMNQDMDKDGKVSKDEFKGPDMIFNMLDKNGDGFVAEDEAPKGRPPGGGFPRG